MNDRPTRHWRQRLTRLYVLLSAAWIIWGLYQPWHQRYRDLQEISASTVRVHKSCLDDGLPLEYCWRFVTEGEIQMDKISKESAFHAYGGAFVLSAICLLPPAAVYLLFFVFVPGVLGWLWSDSSIFSRMRHE